MTLINKLNAFVEKEKKMQEQANALRAEITDKLVKHMEKQEDDIFKKVNEVGDVSIHVTGQDVYVTVEENSCTHYVVDGYITLKTDVGELVTSIEIDENVGRINDFHQFEVDPGEVLIWNSPGIRDLRPAARAQFMSLATAWIRKNIEYEEFFERDNQIR